MEQQARGIDTRVTLLESRADKLEKRVDAHGRRIDESSAAMAELTARARYSDESMGELKAMGKQTAEAVDDLRQSFAAERVENRNRFAQRDAASLAQIKGYAICAAVTAAVTYLLTAFGIK